MPLEVHLNDIGTIFEITLVDQAGAAIDVSSATVTKNIIFRKSDDAQTVITKIASFTTDGTDGKIEYQAITGDLDTLGVWHIQGYVVLSSGEWKSAIGEFRVHENL